MEPGLQDDVKTLKLRSVACVLLGRIVFVLLSVFILRKFCKQVFYTMSRRVGPVNRVRRDYIFK